MFKLTAQTRRFILDPEQRATSRATSNEASHGAFRPGAVFALAACLCLTMAAFAVPAVAQGAASAAEAVPAVSSGTALSLIRWSGSLPESAGRTIQVRFALYQDQAGGLALWGETQTVRVGADGRYSVLLGATSAEGLPQSLFQAREARWIEARPISGSAGDAAATAGAIAPPRSLLAAVPYAFKAVDSESLAGRAAADYLTREDLQSAVAATVETVLPHPETTPSGSGTTNYVPLWTGASTLGNSVIAELGTKIGIGTAAPVTTLDVNGASTLGGTVVLPAFEAATAAVGISSPLLELGASAFSSTTKAAVAQNFAWKAVPSGNNTATPAANLELLFGKGTVTPTATGLSIASTGQIVFAASQTFPGLIKSVTATSPITGTTTAGAVTLGLSTAGLETTLNPVYARLGAANTFTAPITFAASQAFPGTLNSVAATSPVTASTTAGAVSLGLNTSALETTLNGKYAQLATGNTFASSATFGSSSTTGYVESYQLSGPGFAALLGWGVKGSVGAFGDSDSGYGVQGVSNSGPGVFGQSSSPALGQAGVFGQLKGSFSNTYATVAGSTADANTLAAGVWGDGASVSGLDSTAGVVGTAGAGYGGVFFNNNIGSQSIFAENVAAGSSGNNPVVVEALTSGNYAYNIYASAAGINTRGVDAVVTGKGSTGVYGESDGAVNGSASPTGVKGIATGTEGNGVVADETGAGGYGIYAHANGAQETTGHYAPVAVYALSESGNGVLGINTGSSSTYNTYKTGFDPSVTAGVWGDTSSNGADFQAGGIMGTADNNSAAYFANNSSSEATVFASNLGTGGDGLFKVFKATTRSGTCGIGDGDLTCTGQVKTLSTTGGGAHTVETYAMQSPENWMEDFGTGILERGVALVKIDPAFAETTSETLEYHVFLTPRGDSKGLYVINASATSFEVRESGGGTSSLSFDYRIVAKRRGYEAQRLRDVTHRFQVEQAKSKRLMPGEIVARASKGEVEAQMVEPHPPVSRLAKTRITPSAKLLAPVHRRVASNHPDGATNH